MRRTNVIVFALAASAAAGLAALPQTAAAKPKRPKPARSHIAEVVTPLGLQGASGAGGNIVIPFTVADIGGRPADVEVQYGVDVNADGQITEDEYRPATEDRLDPRDTRQNRAPQLFHTGTNVGAVNAFVWRSLADVGAGRFLTLEYAVDDRGRYIPDPNTPGSFLFATGPSGNALLGGVKIRVRTALQRKRHGPFVYSAWMYTNSFPLNNAVPPQMTIDSTFDGAPVFAHWSVYHPNSEDLNGNGQLDVASGEDMSGDGLLDCMRVGIAFDWHRLAPGENPVAMTDGQLAALSWSKCTRLEGFGDTDTLSTRPGVPIPTDGDLAGLCSAPPGVGRHWTFAWDAATDAGVTTDGFILRATPFDQNRTRGATVYSRIVVHSGE